MSSVVQNAIYSGPFGGSKTLSGNITVEETFMCIILSSSSENAVVKRSNGDVITLPLSCLKIFSPKWHAGDAVYITSRLCQLPKKGNVQCVCVRCINDIKREVISVKFKKEGIYEYHVGRFGNTEFIVPENEILSQTLATEREKFKKNYAEYEKALARENGSTIKAFYNGINPPPFKAVYNGLNAPF